MAAICQIRHRDSDGRALLRPQGRRGQDQTRSAPRPEATDQQRRLPPTRPRRRRAPLTTGPGRTTGSDSTASVAGSHPYTPALRRVTPGPTTTLRPRHPRSTDAPDDPNSPLTQRGFGRWHPITPIDNPLPKHDRPAHTGPDAAPRSRGSASRRSGNAAAGHPVSGIIDMSALCIRIRWANNCLTSTVASGQERRGQR